MHQTRAIVKSLNILHKCFTIYFIVNVQFSAELQISKSILAEPVETFVIHCILQSALTTFRPIYRPYKAGSVILKPFDA